MSESEACNIHGTIVTKVNCLLENISTEKTMKNCKMPNGKFLAKFKVQVKDFAVFLVLYLSLLSYLLNLETPYNYVALLSHLGNYSVAFRPSIKYCSKSTF